MQVRIKIRRSNPLARVPAPKPSQSFQPRWTVLWQIVIVTLPAAFFIFQGQLFLAALSFYSLFGLAVGYYAIRNVAVHATALVVGSIPMLMLLRPIFYHNSISVIFFGVLVIWLLACPTEIRRLLQDRLLLGICLCGFIYWWLSFLLTGSYATNLRTFELVLGACVVFVLGRFRSYLAPALWGLGASTVIIVGCLWRYGGERLGLAEVGGQTLGHPQQVGMAATLLILASLTDGGRWLSGTRGGAWRYAVAAASVVLLLLTTSRTSWLLALTGLSVLAISRAQRHYLLPALLVLMMVVAGVLASSRGNLVLKYVDKVISSKRTLSQKTSGRIDMYAGFPEMFWQSPIWGLGPGAATSTYRTSSGEVFTLHSLILHLGVEAGTIGLATLVVLYGAVLRRAWVHRKMTGELVPMAGALCACVDALAHNSFNPLMGIYLGLALTDLSRFWLLRPVAGSLRRLMPQPGRMQVASGGWPAPSGPTRSRFIPSVLPVTFN